jgi:hypothetical protein
MRTVLVIGLLVGCFVDAAFQQLSSQTRAQQIAAAFNKHKHVVKEKYGVTREKYKDVWSEPVVKRNIRDYAGSYEVSDFGYRINIQVATDGTVQANGSEGDLQPRTFRLENARIEGALLTARKVYSDGAAEKFEGVFMTRTERSSPTDPGVTTFGLGVVLGTPVEWEGITLEKLFYQLKQ